MVMSESHRTTKEHDHIIACKSVSYALSSPIDTFRQNRLLLRPMTMRKLVKGGISAYGASFCIAYPCHKVMALCSEKFNMKNVAPIIFGVLVANIVKTPILMNHKSFQTGLSLTKKFNVNTVKEVIKISMVEDVIEESAKFAFARYNMKQRSDTTNINSSHNKMLICCLQAAALFSISYPFDVLKNRRMYSTANINVSSSDFFVKAIHKNIQNMMFFSMIYKG
tara:strand:- start:5509 stop:6177 length:669 start_codon:yes stop_codon:yes gene_type:complete